MPGCPILPLCRSPLGKGSCQKIGRASLLASRRPSKSLPHEARREPRPPDLGRFLSFSHLRGEGSGEGFWRYSFETFGQFLSALAILPGISFRHSFPTSAL